LGIDEPLAPEEQVLLMVDVPTQQGIAFPPERTVELGL
jgi:hypothetical protein